MFPLAQRVRLGFERVHFNDLDTAPAQAVVDEITAAGGRAVICTGNVTAPDFGERFVGTATGEFGGLDVIINNAGYTWDTVVQPAAGSEG